jgi:hypothetical protein
VHVILDRRQLDVQLAGDLFVRESSTEQVRDLVLPVCQFLRSPVLGGSAREVGDTGQQSGRDLRRARHLASTDALDSIRELLQPFLARDISGEAKLGARDRILDGGDVESDDAHGRGDAD